MTEFHGRNQRREETLMEFFHALLELMDQGKNKDPTLLTGKDTALIGD